LGQQQQLLQRCVQQRLEQLRHRHGLLLTRLDAISPLATLARGYSITQDTQGQVLRSVTHTAPGQLLTTRLGDGELQVEVQQVRVISH
jgi:exodeoxyribonuclease VII large subunit